MLRAMNTTTQPAVGIATILGILITIGGAASAVVAAIKSNDTATVTAGVTVIASGLATVGGRMAQAIKLASSAAPIVGALAAGLEDIPGLSEGVKGGTPVEGSDG